MKKMISIFLVLLSMFYSINLVQVSALSILELNVNFSRTTTSVKLKWNNIGGFYSYYSVYRKRADKKSKYKLVCKNTTDLSFRDENLRKNTKYEYLIKAYACDDDFCFAGPFFKTIIVKTKKPIDYKNPRKYIEHMTNSEKLKLIEKDFNNQIKISKKSKIEEFKVTNYSTGLHNGYKAKIEISKSKYTKFYKMMSNASEYNLYYYKNVFGKNYKYCTRFYSTFRSGRLTKKIYIKTVQPNCAVAIIDGKYYLLVDCIFSTANESFSKKYNDKLIN